jgi:hypothetical protein
MKFTRSIPVLFGLALLLSAPRARAAHFEKDILPVLKLFCYDCHGDGAQKGGVSFDTFDSQAKLMKDMDLWSRVLSQVSFGNMPPGPRPGRSCSTGSRPTSSRSIATIPIRAGSRSAASIAPSTTTPFAISSAFPFGRPMISRPTIQALASTTSATSCRSRPCTWRSI